MHLDQITAQCAYHYNGPPAPAMLARACEEYRHGVSEDWSRSVQKYPEILQYYFGLTEVNLPRDDALSVTNPPMGVLQELRARNRYREEAAAAAAEAASASASAASAAAAASIPHHHSHHHHPAAGSARVAARGAPFPFFRPPGF